MRELKFRAYIKEDNAIYDIISIMTKKFPDEDFIRVFSDKPLVEGEPTNHRIDGIDNILMQYMFDDTEGESIFENDIIELDIWGDGIISKEIVPKFDNTSLHWYGELQNSFDDKFYIKKIGNYLTNPELLGKQ